MVGQLTVRHYALGVAILAAEVIFAALVFEHGFGYVPCPLCLQQRWPYYIGIVLAVAVTQLVNLPVPRVVLTVLMALIALVFLVGAGLGVHHAGVEWGFWAGPADCSGVFAVPPGDMMEALRNTAPIVRCDEASWRFLGLSFAGWNVLFSLALAGLAAWGARQSLKDQGSSSVSQ